MTTHVRVNHAATAEKLRANPSVWMTVGEYRNAQTADHTAAMIRAGRWTSGLHYQPAGAYQARTVLTDDGTRVEARYLAPDAVLPISAAERSRIKYLVAALVVRQRLAALEETRQRLPLDDPDRHALDLDADRAFAQLACDHPETCACPEETP
ncbi:hypothetical protein K4749_01045 [Streptomyces sp. TRM72054]|uniref:hypothetical protein n=1 Tax=Streptomyces sp. TRM72054 TaxID=2870562 RepID=UPI001C8C3B73|nr:hypothetical protein [Streptomyces sp. TRM72054]MBX9392216.1 hypothetical protein [Streptomyces sp. TRM72054]